MRITKLIIVFIVLFSPLCSAQNRLYINNEADSAIGKHDSVGFTGGSTKVVITQRDAPSNEIYFDAPIFLNRSQIDTLFCRRTFLRNFVMKNCVVKSDAVFEHVGSTILQIDSSIFLCDLELNGRFKEYGISGFSFIENRVMGKTHFWETKFRETRFNSNEFKSVVSFDDCIFINTYFHKVRFGDSLVFRNLTNENVYFNRCSFSKTLSLKGFIAPGGRLNFDSCDFERGLILSELPTGISFSFKDIVLPDTLDLSNNSVISNSIDLTNVNFRIGDERCAIFLYKTDIAKIQLDYKYFELKFKMLDGHEMSKNEKEIVYEALLKNFKDHGQVESYELLDIEYRDFKSGWFKPLHYWNCYGYHKEWIVYWSLFLIILYTTITFFCFDTLTKQVYTVKHIPPLPTLKQIEAKEKYRNSLIRRRYWYSFVYTATIFFVFLLKVDNIRFKKWLGLAYIVIVVYGSGILCLGYIANLLLQK